MMIAARNAFLMGGASTPTARDYVQDGLVAMWDGIENAGWGVHSNAITAWVDLIGGLSTTTFAEGQCVIGSDYLDVLNISGSRTLNVNVSSIARMANGFSFECVAKVLAFTSTYARIVEWPNAVIFMTNSASLFRLQAYPSITYDISTPTSSTQSYHFDQDLSSLGQVFAINDVSKWSRTATSIGTNLGSTLMLANGGFNNRPLDVRFSSIRIYSRALTVAEVAENFAVDAARFEL